MQRLSKLGLLKLSFYFQTNDCLGELGELSKQLIPSVNLTLVGEKENDFLHACSGSKSVWGKIAECCDINPIVFTCIELAALSAVNKSTVKLIEAVAGVKVSGINIETATRVAFPEDDIFDHFELMREAYDILRRIFLNDGEHEFFYKQFFSFDARLTELCYDDSAQNRIDNVLVERCDFFKAGDRLSTYGDTAVPDEFCKQLRGTLFRLAESDNNDFVRVVISGETGSGRTHSAKYLAKNNSKNLICVSYNILISDYKIFSRIVRETFLTDSYLAVNNIKFDDGLPVFLKRIQDEFAQYVEMFNTDGNALFFILNENEKLAPMLDGPVISINIEQNTFGGSEILWQSFFAEKNITGDFDFDEIASLIAMNPGQIKKVAQAVWCRGFDASRMLGNKEFYRICYEVLDDGRYENVHRVEPGYSFDDLKVDENIRLTLVDICNQVRFRNKVYNQWGVKEKYAYGRSVSVLLAGPPGTGKTMAVHALADALKLELYKVDLSQLIDKYIGETEKRIDEVFKKAQKSNMILFFDEADAVLGKRTDTADARDKSSNSQIAFILQRIEEFDGIVVLASNLPRNMDSAFMRRIKYVIRFEAPDTKTRENIWRSVFAKNVPLDDDIDYEYLSENFEISGAVIKNIALNATFFAAAESCSVGMAHIMRAIGKESSKDLGILSHADLSRYRYLM